MEVTHYLRLLRRWLWLIVLIAVIGGGIAFIITARRPPEYEAQTTVAIGRFIEAPNPNAADIRTGIDLAQTYAQIVRTFDVLQGVITSLDLPMTADKLQDRIRTRILTGTSLLVISVTYDDPVLVADIANGLAEQLVLNSPTNLTPDQQQQVSFLNTQIQELSTQASEGRLRLEQINAQLLTATNQAETDRLNEQRNATIDQINQAQATIAQFTETIASLQQRTNSLDIVESARIPTQPVGTRPEISAVFGALIGAALAIGAALLIEYLDDTIRTTEDAAQTTALPVLGGIIRFGKRRESYRKMLLTNFPSMSPVAESYRLARTNMLFTTEDRKGIFVVTSANPQEGKTVTISNLAVSMAQGGLQVLLIDADLRRPKLHDVFNLENKVGLTTLLFSDPTHTNGQPRTDDTLTDLPAAFRQCVQYTGIPKLRVLTSGFIPSNPTEILGSALMAKWVETLSASSSFDIILIDSPPCLAVADSTVLAANTGANVVMVIDCGVTRRGAALKAKDQFAQLGLEVKGVIVNRINPRHENYGYYGYYYAPQYSPNAERKPPTDRA